MSRIVRIKAQALDLTQYLFGEFKYNDHQIHCVIQLRGRIDTVVFVQAIQRSMEVVPLLGSRFVINAFRPYWEKSDSAGSQKAVDIIETVEPQSQVECFLTSRTNALAGPQLKAAVIRGQYSDTLCFVVNHMVCDAAGFKQYIYLLNEIYEGLLREARQLPSGGRRQSRSLSQVYKQFTFFRRLRILCLPPAHKSRCLLLAEPAEQSPAEPLRSFVKTLSLMQSGYRGLKAYGKTRGVTLNDLVLTACFRTVYTLLNTGEETALNIPCTVDLRRYLPGDRAEAICNLASWIGVEIVMTNGETFDATLEKIHRYMEARKQDHPGLGGLGIIQALFNVLPFYAAKKLLAGGLQPSNITVSNFGIIEKDKISFGSLPIEAYITASNKYPPYFQLGFSTFDEVITFSINLPDSKHNQGLMHRFWSLFDKELPER